MGAETGKQNWPALLFSNGPDSYIEFRLFLSHGVLFQYAGVSCELGGRWRDELPQYLISADTQQQYTAPAHPVWYPPGNMGLAFADSSFLDWVGFLRRRVLKLGSLLLHQGAVHWHCRKLYQ